MVGAEFEGEVFEDQSYWMNIEYSGRPLYVLSHRLLFRIGEAYFDDVPAVVYDFSEFSAHVGLKIDGIIGFPLFRDTLLTLDYPAAQLEIAPNPVIAPPPVAPPQGSIIAHRKEWRRRSGA